MGTCWMRKVPASATFERDLAGAHQHQLETDMFSEVHVATYKPPMEHVD